MPSGKVDAVKPLFQQEKLIAFCKKLKGEKETSNRDTHVTLFCVLFHLSYSCFYSWYYSIFLWAILLTSLRVLKGIRDHTISAFGETVFTFSSLLSYGDKILGLVTFAKNVVKVKSKRAWLILRRNIWLTFLKPMQLRHIKKFLLTEWPVVYLVGPIHWQVPHPILSYQHNFPFEHQTLHLLILIQSV